MQKSEAEELFEKFKNGTCNASEMEAIRYWLYYYRSETAGKYSSADLEKISEEIWSKVEPSLQANKPRVISLKAKIAAAAAIVLLALGGLYFMQNKAPLSGQVGSVYKNDIDPGGEKAYLTLADGKKISLDHLQQGGIAQPGVEISKSPNGMVVYKVSAGREATDATNTLETPNGGKFSIVLPDGTKAWLNAASRLTYPLSFRNKEKRIVTLSGEGYFEVAHDKAHPFLVNSQRQTVQVLGTHFNIQAYPNEKHIRTTLLSGSVRISGNTTVAKILKPGEQADFDTNGITVSQADKEQANAWINDDFVFNGEDLHTVMRQVARWYDVEVVYDGEQDNAAFYSTISRRKKLSEILKALTMNQGIHFKLEGRRVTVMP
ncbi:FecR family protein [Pedobacter frigidisoli]|uniref:FecR family protein n=1 Tax=Pedobacter frigidisoli TaxID=2530455 RepID=UPI00292D26B6|nr:FecR domain-containing protein [Pedobacter frigidisoli]